MPTAGQCRPGAPAGCGRLAGAGCKLVLTLGLAALAACATPPQAASTVPGVAAASFISGRMVLQVAADAQRLAQNLSAAFELQADANAGELRLMAPLGAQLAAARWSPGQASLRTPQGTRQFESLDELARQALGEAVPLAALPSWLAGRPWAGLPVQPQPEGFEQAGWQVLLARQAEGWIEVRRAAPPAVVLRVRLDAPA